MKTSVKRLTVYLDPILHQALRLKSIKTSRSMSEIVNDALKGSFAVDVEDLSAFEERADDPLIPYERMIKRLQKDGRIESFGRSPPDQQG